MTSVTSNGVLFTRVPASGEATLWTGPEIRIPHGELSGTEQAAWMRGVLTTLFGEPDEQAADYGKIPEAWFYELQVTVGEQEARLWIGACLDMSVSFGLSGKRKYEANHEDPRLAPIVREALLDLFEGQPPADFSAHIRGKHAAVRYGCRKGLPWVGTKNALHQAGPLRDDPSWIFHVEVERTTASGSSGPAEIDGEPDISEEDIVAYHAAHAPPGSPPLATMRDHVRSAIAAARRPAGPPADVRSRAIAQALGELASLALFDFIFLAAGYHSRFEPTPQDARRGRRKVDQLAARIRRILAGEEAEPAASPYARVLPIAAHAELWREVADDLEAIGRLLDPVAAADGRFVIRRAERFR